MIVIHKLSSFNANKKGWIPKFLNHAFCFHGLSYYCT